jgi:uncharacterized protein with PIN domain
MLGRLARWLRGAGLDVLYNQSIDRSSLIRIAREDGRTILTRAHFYTEIKNAPPFIILKSEAIWEQLSELRSHGISINKSSLFTRCMVCNNLLHDADKNSIKDLVPSRVYNFYTSFKICPSCNKVYWRGTHAARIENILTSKLAP